MNCYYACCQSLLRVLSMVTAPGNSNFIYCSHIVNVGATIDTGATKVSATIDNGATKATKSRRVINL